MIIEWWNSLGTASQVFYCLAIPATVVLIVQTVMMFLGFGDHADGADGDVFGGSDVPDDIPDGSFSDDIHIDGIFGEDSVSEAHDGFGSEGLRIFTIRGIVAFFVVFGWVGIVMQSAGVHIGITLPVAAVCGFAIMIVLAFLLKAIMKLRNDGNIDNRNAVGTSGKVYLTIPPSRTGEGKVQIMLQGSFVERNAVTDSEEAIPTGCEIVVVGVSGQTDLVVRKK